MNSNDKKPNLFQEEVVEGDWAVVLEGLLFFLLDGGTCNLAARVAFEDEIFACRVAVKRGYVTNRLYTDTVWRDRMGEDFFEGYKNSSRWVISHIWRTGHIDEHGNKRSRCVLCGMWWRG